MATIFLGLGSNIGDRRRNLKRALAHLPPGAYAEELSSIYESEPMYEENQPRFYNMVIRAHTKLSPENLLLYLKSVERLMGRQEGTHNLPRPIDLDILFYDTVVHESDTLTIPHPRLHERPFVLTPLLEIAPMLSHPARKGKVIADLHADISHMWNKIWKAPETI